MEVFISIWGENPHVSHFDQFIYEVAIHTPQPFIDDLLYSTIYVSYVATVLPLNSIFYKAIIHLLHSENRWIRT